MRRPGSFASRGRRKRSRSPSRSTSAVFTGRNGRQRSRGDQKAQAAGDPDTGETYYHHWLATLERIVAAKGLADRACSRATRDAWEHACERTPHGTRSSYARAIFKAELSSTSVLTRSAAGNSRERATPCPAHSEMNSATPCWPAALRNRPRQIVLLAERQDGVLFALHHRNECVGEAARRPVRRKRG